MLIVSPHFPPSTVAGVHRARHLAKHLPDFGWWPVVVRVDETHYTERADPGLAALVPNSVEQVRAGAVPAGLSRLVGIGDIGLRSFVAIERAVARAAAIYKPRIILITGSPYYPMLLSGWIKRHLGIPVVLDFQDPWVSAEGATHARWSKRGLSHWLAVVLEPRAIRHADFVTSVSDRQNAEMAERYPWLDRTTMAAIPIGGEPEDFDALRVNPLGSLQLHLDTTRINLSYVGTFLPRARELVRELLQALLVLKQQEPELATRVRLNFVGTSNQPNDHGVRQVTPIAEEVGVAELVTEAPQRVPFLEALTILANSDGLLLIGSDEPHYTASKIYPALMSGRPYLSLFHVASSAHAILSAAGGGCALSFANAQQLVSLRTALASALRQLAFAPETLGYANPIAYEAYTARNISRAFADIFERILS